VVALAPRDWALAALTGALPLVGMEFEKAWRRTYRSRSWTQ
jgi:hypothetical protein